MSVKRAKKQPKKVEKKGEKKKRGRANQRCGKCEKSGHNARTCSQ